MLPLYGWKSSNERRKSFTAVVLGHDDNDYSQRCGLLQQRAPLVRDTGRTTTTKGVQFLQLGSAIARELKMCVHNKCV